MAKKKCQGLDSENLEEFSENIEDSATSPEPLEEASEPAEEVETPEVPAPSAGEPETALGFLLRLSQHYSGRVALVTRNSRDARALLLELQRARPGEGTLSLDRCRFGLPGGTVLHGCFQPFHIRAEAKWGAAVITPGAPPKMIDALRRRLAPNAEVFGP